MTVKVSGALYSEIMEIKESGAVDVNDSDAVLDYAKANDFGATVRMICGNSNRYLRCITDGMEPMD